MYRHRHITGGGFVALLFVFAVAGPALAGTGVTGDSYPLATCPVSGGKLGSMGDPLIFEHEGREIRLCCRGCLGKFKSDPAKYLKSVDEAIVKEQAPHYPLDTCPIMGKKFTKERPGLDHVVANRLVRVCCKSCIKRIEEDPAPVLAKLDKAVIEAQKKDYPLDTCVITGEKLDGMGGAIDIVHANRLIRLCCKGCIRKVRQDPRAALAKIDAAKTSSKATDARESDAQDPGGEDSGSEGGHGEHGSGGGGGGGCGGGGGGGGCGGGGGGCGR